MLTLGIETSGSIASVALLRDGICLDEREPRQSGRRHAQTLVAEIDRLFRDFDVSPADCEAVAVSIGPGSFTGLRVGVVCAKTLAYAASCRLAAVETFAAIAQNSPDNIEDILVTADAQRGELYVGRYHRQKGAPFQRDGEIIIVDGTAWTAARSNSDFITGPGIAKYADNFPACCHVLPLDYWRPEARTIAKLGLTRIETGKPDDPWSLEPFYLRKSAAEEKKGDGVTG